MWQRIPSLGEGIYGTGKSVIEEDQFRARQNTLQQVRLQRLERQFKGKEREEGSRRKRKEERATMGAEEMIYQNWVHVHMGSSFTYPGQMFS